MNNAFDLYKRRLSRAMADIPHYDPAAPGDRGKIVETIKGCLGIETEWTPDIKTQLVQTRVYVSSPV